MSRDQFEPALYCVMAMGGSAIAHALAAAIGAFWTFLIGVAVVVMLCRDLTAKLRAGSDFDYAYLRLGGAFMVYIVYTIQYALDPKGQSSLTVMITLLYCCVLLPLVELAMRHAANARHSKLF